MATTWSATNKSTSVTLSNGQLTATNNNTGSPGPMAGRCDTSFSGTQKLFWVTTNNVNAGTNNDAVGAGNSSWVPVDTGFIGGDTVSLGYYGTGGVFVNFVLLTTISTFTAGAIIGQAWDFAAGKVWYTSDGTNWNVGAGGTQDPGSNQGGITHGITGALFPLYQTSQSSGVLSQWTANFGATTLPYTTPSGFTTFDSSDVLFGQAVM